MGIKVILDSVIIIDHLNNIDDATQFILNNYSLCHITPITRAEVLAGASTQQFATVQRLLDTFMLAPLTEAITDHAAQLRQQYRWKLPDAFQASTAIINQHSLVTRNTKDFCPKQHDFVVVPYAL